MGGDLVGDHTRLHIVAVRQSQVLLRRDVAEHCRAAPTNVGSTNSRSNVVITRGNVGDQWAESIERRLVAPVLLQADILLHQVQRHMARPLNHHLHVVLPRPTSQLTESPQLRKLRGIIRIGGGTRAQTVAK